MRRTRWIPLALIVAACAAAEPDATGDAPSATLPPDQFVEVNGVNLHYLDWGGDGELLLLVHGLPGSAHAWNAVAPLLTDQFRVVAVTRRDHGASEKTDATFDLDTLADDLAGVINSFSDGPAVVVGWSYAGIELPRLAQRHPSKVKALVFTDALFDISNAAEQPAVPGYAPPDSVYRTVADAVDEFATYLPTVDRSVLQQYLGSVLRETGDGTFVWQLPFTSPAMGRFVSLMQPPSPDTYGGIDAPVLALVVDQSDYYAKMMQRRGLPADSIEIGVRVMREFDRASKQTAVNTFVAAVPHAQIVWLDEVSHNFPIEEPQVLIDQIRAFVGAQVR